VIYLVRTWSALLSQVHTMGPWPRLLALFVALVATATARADDALSGQAPSADQCISFHVDGQALRVAGSFATAASKLRQCLHLACSPVLRAECATLLDAVESEMPTVVLGASLRSVDLTEVSVRDGGRLIAQELDGRPIALDAGPHELLFEAPNLAPVTQAIVVRAGEKNRLVSVVFEPAPSVEQPAAALVPAPASVSPQPLATGASARQDSGFFARVRPWDYALFGVSLGLAGAGLAVGLSARDDADECRPLCANERTQTIRRNGIIADTLFGLSAATMVYLSIRIATHEPRRAASQVLLGPGSLGGRWSF
jgi:hypothetical protein